MVFVGWVCVGVRAGVVWVVHADTIWWTGDGDVYDRRMRGERQEGQCGGILYYELVHGGGCAFRVVWWLVGVGVLRLGYVGVGQWCSAPAELAE